MRSSLRKRSMKSRSTTNVSTATCMRRRSFARISYASWRAAQSRRCSRTDPAAMTTRVRSVRCHAVADDIGRVVFEEIDLPAPGPGKVQVRLKACAVNSPDILMIQGNYQLKPPLPFAPGGEAAGDVVAV